MPTNEDLARRIEAAILAPSTAAFSPLLREDVTWGDCAGRADVLAFIEAAMGEGVEASSATVTDLGDRLHAELELRDAGTSHLVLFVVDGLVTEMQFADDAGAARRAVPLGDLAAAATRPVIVERTAPIFPVGDIDAALVHYERLGFEARGYEGGAAYGFVSFGDVEIHLSQATGLDPSETTSACYLYVSDADSLYARWRRAGVAGRLIAPADTEYGIREGAHVDTDGNLIRFGSPMS